MMRSVLALILLAAGCAYTQDHGRGECVSYTPWFCGSGRMCCTTDERGCSSCTCLDEACPRRYHEHE